MISSLSVPFKDSFKLDDASSIAFFSASVILDPCSLRFFSVEWIKVSAWFLTSTDSLFFLSSSLLASASFTIFSISSSFNPPEAWIWIFCSFPVPLSFAETLTIPLASISKVTSICGTPLGAGAIPTSSKLPNILLSVAISLSPWSTLIDTAGWLSSAVENTWLFLVGIVVFFSISLVDTPPKVSIPKESGVTSNNSTSLTSPWSTPAWIAAPIATTSSGLTLLFGSFPKKFLTSLNTFGILVIPPTIIISSISLAVIPASFKAVLQGGKVLAIKSSTSASSFALVIFKLMCLGPVLSAVIKGRLISVCSAEESSIFAFSEASFNLWSASLSDVRSIPLSFLNSAIR